MYQLQPEVHPDAKDLRRPNQFPNLDQVERPPLSNVDTLNTSIINFPLTIGRIPTIADEGHQTVSVDLCTRRFTVDEVEQRSVEVKQDTSTVVQFRAIDWGMELCRLHITLPANPNDDPAISDKQSFSWATKTEGDNSLSSNFLTIQRVRGPALRNWTNRNKCTADAIPFVLEEDLGQVHWSSDSGAEWSHSFHCHTDSLHTFVVKRGAGSTVDAQWWQDKDSLSPSIYITQHPTV